jgi:hypothetical protein
MNQAMHKIESQVMNQVEDQKSKVDFNPSMD